MKELVRLCAGKSSWPLVQLPFTYNGEISGLFREAHEVRNRTCSELFHHSSPVHLDGLFCRTASPAIVEPPGDMAR